MTETVCKKINGVNNVILSVITGKTTREEAVEVTCSFNLVKAIRVRSLQ